MSNRRPLLAKTLIAGTALLTLSAFPCFAGGSDGYAGDAGSGETSVINGQINLNNIFSQTNADAINVEGDAVGTATAVGNQGTIFTFNNTYVENTQANSGNVSSEVNANMKNVGGDVSLAATSVCNTVDISTDPQYTSINNKQYCNSYDPSATVNGSVSNVGGVVAMQATSVGNQISSDSNASYFPVQNTQVNTSAVNATVNAQVANVGAFGAQTSAVGNSAQIIHYTTGE